MDNNRYDNAEIERMNNYIEGYYSEQVPPPEKPSFLKAVGAELAVFTLTSGSFALFSAFRTGGYFFLQEVLYFSSYSFLANKPALVNLIAIIVAVLAVIGFEGTLLGIGFRSGRKGGGKETTKGFGFTAFLVGSVIILAGGFTGLPMLTNISQAQVERIETWMIIYTSIAAGIIVGMGGRDIGIAFFTYDEKVAEHQANYDKWKAKAIASYNEVRNSIIASEGSNDFPNQSHRGQSSNEQLPTDWRKRRPQMTPEEIIELINLSKEDVESYASRNNVDKKTVENWMKYLFERDFSSVDNALNSFIHYYGRFPTPEQLEGMRLPPKEVARVVMNNSRKWLDGGIIDENIIAYSEALLNTKADA